MVGPQISALDSARDDCVMLIVNVAVNTEELINSPSTSPCHPAAAYTA